MRKLVLALAFALAALVAEAATKTPVLTPSPAPAPAPDYVNITQVLVYGGDFSTLVKLLKQSGVGEKFQTAANNTQNGITIFAPKDKAFTTEPAKSLLSNLTDQQVISLLEYHALNSWQSLAELQHTDNNETGTFATYNGAGGITYHYNGQPLQLNITFVGGNVEIITPWNKVQVTNTLVNSYPVSIFAIDQVLLPVDLFAFPAPAPAPSLEAGAPSPSGSSLGTAQSTAAGPGSAPGSAASPFASAFSSLFLAAISACFFFFLL